MTVAKASGTERVVINSGGKSERFVKALYPTLPTQAFVEYGNFIGATLTIAHELGIRQLTLGVMLGKAVKLAAGHLDTHSRKATMDKDFMAGLLQRHHVGPRTLGPSARRQAPSLCQHRHPSLCRPLPATPARRRANHTPH